MADMSYSTKTSLRFDLSNIKIVLHRVVSILCFAYVSVSSTYVSSIELDTRSIPGVENNKKQLKTTETIKINKVRQAHRRTH